MWRSMEMSIYEIWNEVDLYMNDKLIQPDPILDEVLKANQEAELPAIDVSPSQGKFLHLLASLKGAKRILEIGTLGGYSTIWLARALPKDGQLITLELSAHHAEVARANLKRAGVSHLVEVIVGPGLDTLAVLKDRGTDPFDLIFIDADKPNNPNYLKWALELSKRGSLIICDNVVRQGHVVNSESEDENVKGIRQFMNALAQEKRISATAIQTVGSKGYDGFIVGIVE
ncbi:MULTISPECIES: O-methyltransferase [Priestia]|uniref:O-methyltransferase n=3 Tax=Priestia TaxID=2800373 RepID=A0A2C2PJH8_PRIMG|nr:MULTISPECIES: O-methyltransferase [Priestia]AVX08381.1 O-methyltransferase [Bacillus sp. Y-01]KRF55826.1 methyltransferase [Bacillus sp. Soil531]MBZ5481113.1 O-methyltransferase [Bacillus sp. T_4]MCF6796220.1 O-methyltransferase [Bacillus sp. ET1]MEB2275970.1 O-methyltransferase [Bacillus sp. ILBB4]RFB29693.1 O-methyltransferase [Bacillus sp. ALD]RFB40904.1 O-methyltransferase [Bacillus sp. RC]